MGNVVNMSDWVIGVKTVSFDIPIYESTCVLQDIADQSMEYDLTEACLHDRLFDLEVNKQFLERMVDTLELEIYTLEQEIERSEA